ncbi:MAG TPA: GAF domain-containing protein, partial [Kiritimatiellia bacterium]|nr:GAF domain-containing protein [Kiritimatiellia bacterium]
MSEILAGQADYALLISGMAWLFAAVAARGLAREPASAGVWRWFTWFGVAQGLSDWTDIFLLIRPEVPGLLIARLLLLLFASLVLVEFAAGSFWPAARGAFVRHAAVLILITLAFLGGTAGLLGFLATLRPLLLLPAGLFAALALWRPGPVSAPAANRLPVAAGGLAGYVLVLGLVLPAVPLGIACWLPTEPLFAAVLRVPPEFFRMTGAVLAGSALLGHYSRVRRAASLAGAARRRHSPLLWLALSLAGVLSVGWVATETAGRSRAAAMRDEIRLRTQIATASVPREPVLALRWGDADLESAGYQALKALMMSLRAANADLRFVSLMGVRGGESYVLVDSEPPDSPDYSPPGQHYAEADPEYNRLLARAEDFVIGPLYDRWGTWMTGAAPVAQPDPATVVNLALDIDAGGWAAQIALARLPMLLLVLLISGLVAVFLSVQGRTREEARVKAALADRIRAQQEAVVHLARSATSASGDLAASAREITEQGSAALKTERVSVWLGRPGKGLLRCVDLFERSTGRHSAGAVVQSATCPSYFAALAADRAIDAADASRDPRTAELTDDYLAPLRIASLLDAPIRVSGQVEGVVSFEQVGLPRTWQADEIRFAGELADHAAQALLAAERARAAAERKELEERMQQAQKLESLGILAGGIAHDFNNLLMPIMGHADMVSEELPSDSPHQPNLKEIVGLTEKAAGLCRQMLAYAGRGHPSAEPQDLSQVVHHMQPMLEVAVARRAAVECHLAEALPPVNVDAAQFRQVVMNLVLNASEAVEARKNAEGRIRVTTDLVEADQGYLDSCVPGSAALPGRYVFVEVDDNG